MNQKEDLLLIIFSYSLLKQIRSCISALVGGNGMDEQTNGQAKSFFLRSYNVQQE